MYPDKEEIEHTEFVDVVHIWREDIFVEFVGIDNWDDYRVDPPQCSRLPVSSALVDSFKCQGSREILTLFTVRLVRVTLTLGETTFRLPPLTLTL